MQAAKRLIQLLRIVFPRPGNWWSGQARAPVKCVSSLKYTLCHSILSGTRRGDCPPNTQCLRVLNTSVPLGCQLDSPHQLDKLVVTVCVFGDLFCFFDGKILVLRYVAVSAKLAASFHTSAP